MAVGLWGLTAWAPFTAACDRAALALVRRTATSSARCTRACALVLLSTVLAAFAPFFLGHGAWESGDNYLSARPAMLHTLERIGHGELPLWNPNSALGTSFLGQATAAFDPFNALGLLPAWIATTAIQVLELALAGLLMQGLLRALGCRRSAALAGALAYLSMAWPVNLVETRLYMAPFVWMPLGLRLQLAAYDDPRPARVLAAAVPWSLALLGGYPHLWVMVLVAAALTLVVRPSVRHVRTLGATLALTALQTAPVTLTTLHMLLASNRDQLAAPVGGNAAPFDALAQVAASPLLFNFGQAGLGFGCALPVAALALFALLARTDRVVRRLGLALCATALAIQVQPLRALVALALPQTAPLGRFGLLWAIGGALLAANGLDAALTAASPGPARANPAAARAALAALPALLAGIVSAGIAWLLARGGTVFGQPAAAYVLTALHHFTPDRGTGLLALAGGVLALRRLVRASRPVVVGPGADAPIAPQAGLTVVILAALALAVPTRYLVRGRYGSAPPDAALADLLATPVPRAGGASAVPLGTLLAPRSTPDASGGLDPFRVSPFCAGVDYAALTRGGIEGLGARVPLALNGQLIAGLYTPSFYGPFLDRDVAELLFSLQYGVTQHDGCAMTLLTRLQPTLLALTGVRYLLSFDSIPDAAARGLALVAPPLSVAWSAPGGAPATESLHVYEVIRRLPRAFRVGRLRVEPDRASRLARLADPSFDPAREALVEEPLEVDGVDDPGAAVRITAYRAESVELAVEAGRPGLIVLTDACASGWSATLDDAPVRIRRVDHALRGVVVGPGTHVIRFSYRPWYLLPSLTAALAGWVLFPLGIALAGSVRRRERRP